MVPQWDLLDLLVTAARQEPSFRIAMGLAATGLIEENGVVTGVHLRPSATATGEPEELRADVVIACDGRTRCCARRRARAAGVPGAVRHLVVPAAPAARRRGERPRPRVLGPGRAAELPAAGLPPGRVLRAEGLRRGPARRGGRGLPRPGRPAPTGLRRPGRRDRLDGRRARARRPDGPAAPVVAPGAALHRGRRARDVARRRGRHQPGGAGRGGDRGDPGAGAPAGAPWCAASTGRSRPSSVAGPRPPPGRQAAQAVLHRVVFERAFAGTCRTVRRCSRCCSRAGSRRSGASTPAASRSVRCRNTRRRGRVG